MKGCVDGLEVYFIIQKTVMSKDQPLAIAVSFHPRSLHPQPTFKGALTNILKFVLLLIKSQFSSRLIIWSIQRAS